MVCSKKGRLSTLSKLEELIKTMPDYCPKKDNVMLTYNLRHAPTVPQSVPIPCCTQNGKIPSHQVIPSCNPYGGFSSSDKAPKPMPCIPPIKTEDKKENTEPIESLPTVKTPPKKCEHIGKRNGLQDEDEEKLMRRLKVFVQKKVEKPKEENKPTPSCAPCYPACYTNCCACHFGSPGFIYPTTYSFQPCCTPCYPIYCTTPAKITTNCYLPRCYQYSRCIPTAPLNVCLNQVPTACCC